MKTPWGRFLFDNLKKVSGRSFFPFSPATLQKHTLMASFLCNKERKSKKPVPEEVK